MQELSQSPDFDALYAAATPALDGPQPSPEARELRIQLWRKQEFHNWLRWRICAKGFDWSKPGVILLLAAGFGLLVTQGIRSGHWGAPAGGIVLWFTAVNLAFFGYFGLWLPGPPRILPGPFAPNQKIRAELGLYPPGYESRKLARILLRVPHTSGGEPWMIELATDTLSPELTHLLKEQSAWRIQRGDAPMTLAVIETVAVTREEIDAGVAPLKVVAWSWEPKALKPFGAKHL